MKAWFEALDAILQDARGILAAGDHQVAERQAKAVSAFVRAVHDLASLEHLIRTAPKEPNVDDLRAELERRIDSYVEAEQADTSAPEPQPG